MLELYLWSVGAAAWLTCGCVGVGYVYADVLEAQGDAAGARLVSCVLATVLVPLGPIGLVIGWAGGRHGMRWVE